MHSNSNLITLSTHTDIQPEFLVGDEIRSIVSLRKRIRKSEREEEFKAIILDELDIKVGTDSKLESGGIDILMHSILIETKFNKLLSNTKVLAKALSQGIHYLHNIFDRGIKLPTEIYILDNKTAVRFDVTTLVEFIESDNYDWSCPASSPSTKLKADVVNFLSDKMHAVIHYDNDSEFVDFYTHLKIAIIINNKKSQEPIYYDEGGKSLGKSYKKYVNEVKTENLSLRYLVEYIDYILYDTKDVWHGDWKKVKQHGYKALMRYVLSEIYQHAADPHIYQTDMDILVDIIESSKKYVSVGRKILVIATMELLMILLDVVGNDTKNLYFATPSKTKAAEAEKILNKKNVLLYKPTYKEVGVLNFMNNDELRRFDFITGNVPWDGEIDKEFVVKCKNELLADTGTMAIITSASYLRGKGGRKLRTTLALNGNIEKLWIYPQDVFINPDTQLPIKAVGACILYTKNMTQGETQLVRYVNGKLFETTTTFSGDDGAMLYLGDEGKRLWEICTKNQDLLPLKPYQDSNKPKIHFSRKLDLNYFGASKKLGTITGSKLLTGVVLDLDGTKPWVPEPKSGTTEDHSGVRWMLDFETENMARNASFHVAMRVWGLLLGMTGTISHGNSTTLGSMPYDILTGVYDSVPDYEEAYYKSKDLPQDLITWVKTVGIDYSHTVNLKDDVVVAEISRKADRVKLTGELFTPSVYVNKILDELELKGLCDKTKKVLEPSCGDGNFIVPIIERKLASGMPIVDALSTTFGCDLMHDNIKVCHRRILALVGDTKEHRGIVEYNIVQADFTTGFDFIKWNRIYSHADMLCDTNISMPVKKSNKKEVIAPQATTVAVESLFDF